MKHRPSHVSGFRLARDPAKAESGLDEECETGGTDVFSFFVDSLRRERPEVLERGLKGLSELEAAREPVAQVDRGEGFSFGFAFD